MTETQATPVPDANTPTPTGQDAEAPVTEVVVADSSPAVTDTDEIANKAKGVGKRIDELTRLRREAERERDSWREMAMRSQPTPNPEPDQTPKTLADFQYDEAKYQNYLFTTAEQRAVRAAEQRLQEQARNANEARRTQSFKSRESTFAKTQADYYEVAHNESVPISSAMAEAIAESEEGPALAYHLGKNPDIAEQIASLSPLAAARELGRIEARLLTEREKVRAPVVSKAPSPVPKIEGVDPAITVRPDSADSDKMSDAEWMRKREKQLRKRG